MPRATDRVDLGTYPEVARAQAEASQSTPPDEWMSGGTAPMLVIVGLDDRIAVPANGVALATERADTTLLAIPNCGHKMVDEQPERLSRAVAEFIWDNAR